MDMIRLWPHIKNGEIPIEYLDRDYKDKYNLKIGETTPFSGLRIISIREEPIRLKADI